MNGAGCTRGLNCDDPNQISVARVYMKGDIFRIRLDERYFGYGQVVSDPKDDLPLYALFDICSGTELTLDEIVSKDIIVLAHSMDVKITSGLWKVIGNREVSNDMPIPLFRVEHAQQGWLLMDHEGNILRRAKPEDLKDAKRKKAFSPAALEYALKAYCGLVEYREFCNELLIKKM